MRSSADTLFYSQTIDGEYAMLSESEQHHALHVLRLRSGDRISVTDGKGSGYTGPLTEVSKRVLAVRVESTETQKKPSPEIVIGVAPTKSFDRMEWCISKLTEIGVSRIIPLQCQRSERTKWNVDRARKVAISAMKQSRRFWLPECTALRTFQEIVASDTFTGTRYLAHMDGSSVLMSKHYPRGSGVLILIGPEGDFAEDEVQVARDAGFLSLSLGEFRLRTETAAIVAATSVHILNQ